MLIAVIVYTFIVIKLIIYIKVQVVCVIVAVFWCCVAERSNVRMLEDRLCDVM